MKTKKRLVWKTLLLGMALTLLFVFPGEAAGKKASVRLNVKTMVMKVGTSKKLNAVVTGKSKRVVFKSSNQSVAAVSSTGKVTAKKAGKAIITAKANGKTARCAVTVKNADYKSLYKAFLSRGKITAEGYSFKPSYFRVLNIDRKGVPELIVTNSQVSPLITYYVYTVRQGKVRYVGQCSLKGMSMEPYVAYVSKYKGIYTGGWVNGVGGAYSALYGISGKKLVRKQHAEEYHSYADSYYIGTTDKQSRMVSKSKCASFSKKYFKNRKEYKLISNTPANLKRYL